MALRVPIGDKSASQWGKAEIHQRDAEMREAEEVLEELRGRGCQALRCSVEPAFQGGERETWTTVKLLDRLRELAKLR